VTWTGEEAIDYLSQSKFSRTAALSGAIFTSMVGEAFWVAGGQFGRDLRVCRVGQGAE